MNIIKKLWSKLTTKATAIYEGAQWWNPNRSYLWQSVQDARLDISSATRLELVRKSRYWECNSAIAERLCQIYVQYTVGSGLTCIPNTLDDEDNEHLKAVWDKAQSEMNLQSYQSLAQADPMVARRVFFDGEIFILKAQPGQVGAPKVQFIETQRCATPPERFGDEGKSIVDGVEIDANGGIKGYWFSQQETNFQDTVLSNNTSYVRGVVYKFYPAEYVHHVGKQTRAGQYRFIPKLSPILNDIHDLSDLQEFEMQAAKAAAITALVIKNTTGEATDTRGFRQTRLNIQTTNPSGTTTTKSDPQVYDTLFGARTIYLRTNEEAEMFQSNRPTVTMQSYWDYVVGKICAGVSIPMILVFPRSVQGTVTRADLDCAATYFKSEFEMYSAYKREAYSWQMEWQVKYNRSLDGVKDYTSVIIRPPRSVNVDVGYNATALIDAINNCLETRTHALAEAGKDFKEVAIQLAEEVAFINKTAKRFDVDPEQIDQGLFEVMKESETATETKEQNAI